VHENPIGGPGKSLRAKHFAPQPHRACVNNAWHQTGKDADSPQQE